MKFINDQYEKYLQEELNINRKKQIPDSRVHCCIYFIPATGHSYVYSFQTTASGFLKANSMAQRATSLWNQTSKKICAPSVPAFK